MFPPQKILFPIDFSDRCAAIAPTAAAFVKQFNASLTVLHVMPDSANEGTRLLAQDQIRGFTGRGFPGMNVCLAMTQGEPAQQIVEFAQQHNTDLILMPTHGYGPFRRLLLGSVTAKVLHDASCPVWTGAHSPELAHSGNPKFENVICAVDLSPVSHAALRWAAQFAHRTKANLSITHAIPLMINGGAGDIPIPDYMPQIQETARKQIQQLQKSEGMSVEVDVIVGEIARVIRQSAENRKADLLVIGRSAAQGLIGRLGTHAYSIIRHSPCPVVSV